MDKVVAIGLAIISLATVTVLLTNGAAAGTLATSVSSGFSNVLHTAMGGTPAGAP